MNFLASKAQLRASLLRWSLFLVPLIVLLGFLGGQMGSPQTAWFAGLAKPAIYPPPAAFGIVWSILYVLIGFALALVVSAWGAAGRGVAIVVFAAHFIGNLAWTAVFFGMQDITGALIVLGYTLVTLVAVIAAFWRVRRSAALLLLPYLAWVAFATLLNYQFLALNPDGGGSGSTEAVERVRL
ncbi:TspO/MBR family protein [Erythrobacter sp. JK5]|uniref:TspO/MBR family protein n=1 Tax=Erythrobacter sp. JK5 TaxID=2829500 RepID=UPI001BA56787|nr:TspO/MBR family protein [Erythrobacter sp. JK5]QUL38345.1 tryptophan-rich sensory protein [Erythrobacter sp. JK5]